MTNTGEGAPTMDPKDKTKRAQGGGNPGDAVEAHYRTLVGAIRDYAIITLGKGGYVASWNPGAEQIEGYCADEIIGRHFSIFYTAEARDKGWPQYELEQASLAGRFEDEGWRVRRDGSQFWANVTITAIYDEQRNVKGFAKVVRNISDRKRLEELETSSRRMSGFLATLSHELRNPLAPLRNAVNLLRLEPRLPGNVAMCRDMIDRQTSHLARLVDDLLDVGRVISGKIGLRVRNVELHDIVTRAVEAARPMLDARRQEVALRLPADGIPFRGDLTRLVQVLQNLLANASKFSPPGTVVRVEARIQDKQIEICVVDQGCGIHPDALEEIFSLFVQHKTVPDGERSGLGVGLSLCRSLVELHGGSVHAISQGAGRGSTFVVRLPYIPPRPEEDDISERLTGSTLRVMVVDDNRDSADSQGLLLQALGQEALVFYNGASAIEASAGPPPQLALIDLAMPVMDGFRLLDALRAQARLAGTVFVAMTGFGQASDHIDTRAAGFHAHLVKPVELHQLKALLSSVGLAVREET